MNDERTVDERRAEKEKGPGRPLNPDATDPAAAEPHHALSNPATDPDPTEYPDPYERRPDPRGPDDGRAEHGAPSTSEPPPRDHDQVKPEKGA